LLCLTAIHALYKKISLDSFKIPVPGRHDILISEVKTKLSPSN
jgi:hypothetical protein